jgi:hypothetical protein
MHDNTQQSQETDLNTICGIRTRNLSIRADDDPRQRPRGHSDLATDQYTKIYLIQRKLITYIGDLELPMM